MTRLANRGVAIAALVTGALALAPAATARPVCQNAGTQTICQTNGSVSIKVSPGTTAPPASRPVIPWLAAPLAD